MLDQTYIITKDDLAIHFEQVVHKKKFQFSVLKFANKKVFRELFGGNGSFDIQISFLLIVFLYYF